MKAAILRAFGGPQALVIDAVEKPRPGPGEVLIRVEAAGINFTDTGQRAGSLGPMPLPLVMGGEVAGTVEVVGAAPVIATEGAQVSDVKDALRIHDLPLNGRVIANLFNLTPGVEGGGNPRTNGMKVGSTEMNLDGMSMVDRFGGGIARVQPGLDTVQEGHAVRAAEELRSSVALKAEVKRDGVVYARVYDIRGESIASLLAIPPP